MTLIIGMLASIAIILVKSVLSESKLDTAVQMVKTLNEATFKWKAENPSRSIVNVRNSYVLPAELSAKYAANGLDAAEYKDSEAVFSLIREYLGGQPPDLITFNASVKEGGGSALAPRAHSLHYRADNDPENQTDALDAWELK